MMDYQFDLVGKIGSMALIRKEDKDIDYNIFSRLGAELKPGMIWVTSGATEIGRLDYLKRTGCELCGSDDEIKADYAAQGQSILMQNYRQFIHQEYGVRQLLVEHTHFNDPEKREHIRRLLIRAAQQKTIPIVNYNDPVSDEENRKMELAIRRSHGDQVVECVDNDETAAVIANLVHAKKLVEQVTAKSMEELEEKVRQLQESCVGASRVGANGAKAKLEYALKSARQGTMVIIGHARHRLSDLVEGRVACTRIGLE